MDSEWDDRLRERRFVAYLETLFLALGHEDRNEPLRGYCTGLLAPIDRKSVEPIAALTAPGSVSKQHQSLHHFVADAPWKDDAVLQASFGHAIGPMVTHGPISAWVIDDTGMAKKGSHSVGVSRQYCGNTGKKDNCQVAVSLTLANDTASVPVGIRLYLPESWATDASLRKKAKIPDEVQFQKKWEIALGLIDRALETGKPRAAVLADSGYGDCADFRSGLTVRDLDYVVGIRAETTVWKPGEQPLPPLPRTSNQTPTLLRRDKEHKPVRVLELAMAAPASSWREVAWREGTKGEMTSRFLALRVRPAHKDFNRTVPWPEEWLLIEWLEGQAEPTKFWLSTLGDAIPLPELVLRAKARWRIERDYQELKDEIGLDHYEGRSWRGFHHHATLCIATYAFLVAERAAFSPLDARRRQKILESAALPRGYLPRGSAPQPAASADVDHHDAHANCSLPHEGSRHLPSMQAPTSNTTNTPESGIRGPALVTR